MVGVGGAPLAELMSLWADQPARPLGTSREFLASLPERTLTAEEAAEMAEHSCSVCQEGYEAGHVAVKLPCGHEFHKDCLSPWLTEHHTCPTCRHELPTEPPAPPPPADPAAPSSP